MKTVFSSLLTSLILFGKTILLFTLFNTFTFAQTKIDTSKVNDLTEVVVKATRTNAQSGMAYSDVFKKELKKQNLGQDLPFLLNQLPSIVVSSDAGAGIGYTGIRIRGSDPTRINVTLNGIPYNESESQGVYWVNMPDIASSVQSIQVQRGVGTSTNGAGAFGGSINVNTLQLNHEPFSEINTTVGSFNTLKTNLLLSTGIINNRFVVDGRVSKIKSDGFVDRAFSDLNSYYLSGGYYHKNSFVRLNVFSGHEKTYQSWNGIPEALAKNNQPEINAFIDRNYYDEGFKNDMLKSGRRFNFYNYDNEVDDYTQTHYQLISSIKINKNWRFNPTLHYTKGLGFFEQYKSDQNFKNYGLTDLKIDSIVIKQTDLIRRKWLDNDFYGMVWSLDYEAASKLNANIGGGLNTYQGGHFGEIIWAKYASNSAIRDRYYENNSVKTDFNIYAKLYYNVNDKTNIYADMQARSVGFKMNGTSDTVPFLAYSNSYTFMNPKFGVNYKLTTKTNIYGSYAVGNKEPSRQDFVDNAPMVPKPENLQDLEIGIKHNAKKMQSEVNFYYMKYKNQLILTGQVNSVGEAIRVNVPNSQRTGLEFQFSGRFSKKIFASANLTLSSNTINNFEETVVSSDEINANEINKYRKTNISFSPSIIGGGTLTFMPIPNIELTLLPKYVGKQYLDNTKSESKKLDAYFVNDLRISYNLKPKLTKELTFSVLVNNIFNQTYESNGYTYSYIYEKKITENFVFPQAGTNFLAALRVRI